MTATCAPREFGSDLLIKDRQPHRVLLTQTHVGHASGNRRCIIKFIERSASIGHAGRGIDKQCASKVRVLLILLDIEFVLASPYFPIDVPKVISRNVLSVLHKLNALTEIRTAVHAREKSLDHIPSPEFHRRDSPDCVRMQIVFGIGHLAAIGLEQSAYFESVDR